MKKVIGQINRIYYCLILSIFFHSLLFLILGQRKDTSLGINLVPIKIIEVPTESSKGEYFQEPLKEVMRNNHQDLKKKEIRENKKYSEKKLIHRELLKDENYQSVNKELNIKKQKNNTKAIRDLRIEDKETVHKDNYEYQKQGGEGDFNLNKDDQGSLKGAGEERIICLLCVKPEYPKLAIKAGYEGILIIKIWIAKNGEVTNAKIIKSTGFKIFDDLGLNAAKKYKFYPLKSQRTVNIKYPFNLKSE